MRIIFCEDPLDYRQVDAMYQAEADAAQALGIPYSRISFEALTTGAPHLTVKRIPASESIEDALYRGWMLKPDQYRQLYDALLDRGLRLINTPDMYRHTHHLPESYDIIAGHTPRSVWLKVGPNFTLDDVHTALKPFGDLPVIVKDYVKSQKHYWYEACYIPDAADRQHVKRVVSRFLELQGDDLNEGLVFREFVEFQPLTQHSRSDMPLTQEYRVFVADGRPIFDTRYWSEGEYADVHPELSQFEPVMQQVNSRFYTMDIARLSNGTWMIVELGDGQTAGLADHVNVGDFYQALSEKVIRMS